MCISVIAPGNWLAIRAASVSPVSNRLALIFEPAPITWVTAIASPSARPRPSSEAAVTPEAVVGRTTPRTTSQRVAPRALAPSCISRGTARKRSREIEAMIGMIMIVRIRLAVKTLAPVVCGGPKSGMKPSVSCSQGSMCDWTKGARTRIPQKPRMTLGIAASISTSGRDHAAHAARRQQAEEEADRDRDRRADRQRDEGADDGAEDERAGAVDVEVGLPGGVGEEAEPELGDRRAGAVNDLVGDQEQDHRAEQRGECAEAEEEAVTDAVDRGGAARPSARCARRLPAGM